MLGSHESGTIFSGRTDGCTVSPFAAPLQHGRRHRRAVFDEMAAELTC
jgi:hypothetical protein